jgi:DGQHR domain-containing protein
MRARYLKLQGSPPIYVLILPGKWLLAHTRTSWRKEQRKRGFQRIVTAERCQRMAREVLDQGRSFPNAIIIAGQESDLTQEDGMLIVPETSDFLIVDGQHRLWAEEYSEVDAPYSVILHLSLSKVEMAKLFIEINNNQKRVPASLRWDLIRLVRPDDDEASVRATDIIFDLAMTEGTALFQRVDLTGEQGEIGLKQASIAPELKSILAARQGGFRELPLETQTRIFERYFSAIRSLDADGWNDATSPFYKSRVLRALLKLLPELVRREDKPPAEIESRAFRSYLVRIDRETLDPARIRAIQGEAGIEQILRTIKGQVFRSS